MGLAKTIEKENPGSLRGLNVLSRLNLGHAEARLHQVIKDWGLTLPIDISIVRHGLLYVPMIRLPKWWDYILNYKPEIVLGGFPLDHSLRPALLTTFWSVYQQEDPHHPIFTTHQENLGHCIPYWLFGDEGRGHRKAPIQIFAWETCFGLATFNQWEKHGKDLFNFREVYQQTSKGSSFNSRILLAVMPHTMYCRKESKHVWHKILGEIGKNATELFNTGIQVGKVTYYPIALGMKGDAPALVKAGKLTRSFYNLGSETGMCPHCRGGQPNVPWEDMGLTARWIQTIGEEKPFSADQSALSDIPCNRFFPEGFYVQDPFHVFKLGIGRHFVASCIVVLMHWGYWPGGLENVVDLLRRAHDDFAFCCKRELYHATPHIKHFTKENFHYPQFGSFPNGGWKGGDTMLLLRWLLRVFRLGVKSPNDDARPNVPLVRNAVDRTHRPLLEAMYDGTRSALQFFSILHKNGLLLTRMECHDAFKAVDLFCSAYVFLAAKCAGLGLCRFHVQPKLHVFRHISVRLSQLLETSDSTHFLSPAAFLCEMSEDYVGRISRISRRAPARNVCLRTLQRYLIQLHMEWRRK